MNLILCVAHSYVIINSKMLIGEKNKYEIWRFSFRSFAFPSLRYGYVDAYVLKND